MSDDITGSPEVYEDDATQHDGAAPTFILRLADESFTLELNLLQQWVDDLLVPTYIREPSPTAPWCLRWWEHEEALARLHALWLAWQELTDPAAGGWTGPSTWHRDHLDPTLRELRAHDGPLWRCMTDVAKARHRDDVILEVAAIQSPSPANVAEA
ncbi:DUF4913 domain-containing protein [Nonomuraea ceibae]|uniref:DUF4913 domain-containing protein n=1 Tax=Nonomuraea ceibae TaxID=1935170 RepID=UPI001C5FE0AF|nr:DUF4913 domain-containing protein [Nonomuraea ceibae]